MNTKMNELITFLLVVTAIITAWSVLTPNHLFIN